MHLPPEIRTLEGHEHKLIGNLIAEAFADDPVNIWAFNGVDAMAPGFIAMAKYFYLKHGYGHITVDGKAGTLWVRPGVKGGYGIAGNLSLAYSSLRYGGLPGLKNGLAIESCLGKHYPSEPCYYLFAIAVSPDQQGRGLGSLMMKHALRDIDAAGMPVYLENSKPRNTPFYARHGFRVLDEIQPAPDCPPLWRMWRDAR